jgi:hypothetical protein
VKGIRGLERASVQDHRAQELESGQAPEQALAQELGQEQEQEQAEPNSAASMGGPGISRPRPEPR